MLTIPSPIQYRIQQQNVTIENELIVPEPFQPDQLMLFSLATRMEKQEDRRFEELSIDDEEIKRRPISESFDPVERISTREIIELTLRKSEHPIQVCAPLSLCKIRANQIHPSNPYVSVHNFVIPILPNIGMGWKLKVQRSIDFLFYIRNGLDQVTFKSSGDCLIKQIQPDISIREDPSLAIRDVADATSGEHDSATITCLSYELLKTPRGRQKYFTYLNHHSELTPLQRLYGLHAPVATPAEIESHVRKICLYIHSDKVPEEEKEMCTELFKLVMQAREAYNTSASSLPPFIFFMQLTPESIRIRYHNVTADINKKFLSFSGNLLDFAASSLLKLEQKPAVKTHSPEGPSIFLGFSGFFSFFNCFGGNQQPTTLITDDLIEDLIKKTKSLLDFQLTQHSDESLPIKAQLLQNYLVDFKFLNRCNSLEFAWNESYVNGHRTENEPARCFLVLLVLFLLPRCERPLDQLLREFAKIHGYITDRPLADAIPFILGILSLEKMNKKRALDYFGEVPNDSDFRQVAEYAAKSIADVLCPHNNLAVGGQIVEKRNQEI